MAPPALPWHLPWVGVESLKPLKPPERKPLSCHFLVIGGGITGLTIVRELIHRGCEDIILLEKENVLGVHASGRNSGVLHAGIYYTPDTYKARFCIEGNRRMKAFCRDKGLALHERGKVVVSSDEKSLKGLYELKKRADASGAKSFLIDKKELREIEPRAFTWEKALYVPDTAVIDPHEILEALAKEVRETGKVKILWGTSFRGLKRVLKKGLKAGLQKGLKRNLYAVTSHGEIGFQKCFNVAGAFADKVAGAFDVRHPYKLLPFKGTYKRLVKEKSHWVKGNIYPVPNLKNPFLGVHFTKSVHGFVDVGPTAFPALAREARSGLLGEGFSLETLSFLLREGLLLWKNAAFRDSALQEIKKFSGGFFFNQAQKLLPGITRKDVEDSSKWGIRPQLVNWNTKELVTDFVLLREENSVHVLNAVSPAFTCSMAFAPYVVDSKAGTMDGTWTMRTTWMDNVDKVLEDKL